MLADRRCHRDRLIAAVAAEDVTRQPPEADIASALLIAGDRRLGSNPRTIATYFNGVSEPAARIFRLLGFNPNADHRCERFNNLRGEFGQFHQRIISSHD
jgi:hypothetical protein